MAHELDFSKGFAAIAIGAGTDTPWHDHVNDYLTADDTPETACIKGGINFNVCKAPVTYQPNLASGPSVPMSFENRAILYRDDTGEALSVMSDSHYVPAQPRELVEGLFEVIKGSGFVLDCIMALKGGTVISALARREAEPGQLGDDITLPYLGILTSFNGTFARRADLTAIRRVCMNTVRFSLGDSRTVGAKQRNSSEFTLEKANDLFDKLGEFDAGFARYMETMRAMTKIKMTDEKLARFFSKLYAPESFTNEDNWVTGEWRLTDNDKVSTNKRNTIADLANIFRDSPGSSLPSADGTLYGALNAVTYFQDHLARTQGNKRWESASIGRGAQFKERALELATSLVS